jgi:hypothetical protein
MIEIKNTPPIPGLKFRHFQGESDYSQIAAVLTASEAADQTERNVKADDIAQAFQQLSNCDRTKILSLPKFLARSLDMRVVGGKMAQIPVGYTNTMVFLPQNGGDEVWHVR